MHFIGNVYKGAALLKKRWHIPLLQWSDRWRGRFYSMDVDILLALDASAQGTALKESTLPRTDAGLGLFSSETIRKGGLVRYY